MLVKDIKVNINPMVLLGLIGTIGTVIGLVMWFALIYLVLDHIKATTVMWGVFWLYALISTFTTFIFKWMANRIKKEIDKL